MTRFDIILGKENTSKEKNKLTLVLEEGDDILRSIKQGMNENKIKEASVISVNGNLLEGIISTKSGQVTVEDTGLINAKGKFKFGGDELWGKLNIFTEGKKPIDGILLKGKAKENLEIILEF